MALLNLEMQLIEPLLVTAQTPVWIATGRQEVKAAIMRTDHGVLCLPMWVGPGSQMVPGQAATTNLTIVVPQFVPSRWWHQLLHAQTAVVLRLALLFRPGIVITNVPYHTTEEMEGEAR